MVPLTPGAGEPHVPPMVFGVAVAPGGLSVIAKGNAPGDRAVIGTGIAIGIAPAHVA